MAGRKREQPLRGAAVATEAAKTRAQQQLLQLHLGRSRHRERTRVDAAASDARRAGTADAWLTNLRPVLH